uniref:Receptor ligand binding region domain-containing protein n=1 Tax=Romanomermis culicivorax TaxID=13658 RepID=A0A915HSF0_ROMCU
MAKFFLFFFVLASNVKFFHFGDQGRSLVTTKSSGLSSVIQWPSNISIGFMISAYSNKLYNLTCQSAIGDLKRNAIIPDDLKINIYWRNASDDVTAMNSSLDLYKNRHVDVFFGPEASVASCISHVSCVSFVKARLKGPSGYWFNNMLSIFQSALDLKYRSNFQIFSGSVPYND